MGASYLGLALSKIFAHDEKSHYYADSEFQFVLRPSFMATVTRVSYSSLYTCLIGTTGLRNLSMALLAMIWACGRLWRKRLTQIGLQKLCVT